MQMTFAAVVTAAAAVLAMNVFRTMMMTTPAAVMAVIFGMFSTAAGGLLILNKLNFGKGVYNLSADTFQVFLAQPVLLFFFFGGQSFRPLFTGQSVNSIY